MRGVLYFIFIALLFVAGGLSFVLIDQKDIARNPTRLNLTAGTYFIDSTSKEYLHQKYYHAKNNRGKVRILIVPGHDEKSTGALFRGIKESDMNVEIAEYLADFLRSEKEFDITLLRGKDGYLKEFVSYMEWNKDAIEKFRAENRELTNLLFRSGVIEESQGVFHNYARPEVGYTLYAINKWVNDIAYDIVLHLHFNDYAERRGDSYGKHSGFAIYVPESQFSNAKGSLAVAKPMFEQLARYFPVSDLKGESAGIVEDQELIAIGANNTLDAAALLIEYGYIYEGQFRNEATRSMAMKELALQTKIGIENFFEPGVRQDEKIHELATFPHEWERGLRKGVEHDPDVFALQLALTVEGVYPPAGFTKNDCPISGTFGNCTVRAVIEFQKKHNLKSMNGVVDDTTRGLINKIYGKYKDI